MATATLPRPQRYAAEDDQEFVVFRDVPVFAEHTADDGTVYDKQKLEWICENQNERIRETGDFTPIVVSHTSDPGEEKNDPPVIGFAGPFHIGQIGDQKKRWAILAAFRIFKDDEEVFRRHPRRSVELWVEDDPKDRFFDPISVLGAETPRLDLSLVYSRKHPERRIARYQAAPVAAFPSGSNTFVPSTGKKKHSQESNVALSPDDIKQIVDALQATSEFQFVRELMKQSGGEGDDDSDGAGGQDAGEPSADLPQDGTDPRKEKVDLMRKYAAEGNDEEFNKLYDGLDDEERKHCMAYALENTGTDHDDDDGVEKEPVPTVADEGKTPEEEAEKMRLAKSLAGSVPVSKLAKVERELADTKQNYAKLQKRLDDAEKAAAAEKRRAVRYAKLRDLEAEGFVLDPTEEIEDAVKMSDAQFDQHVAKIHKRYQRLNSDGLNRVVRASEPESLVKQAMDGEAQKERYQKIRDFAIANKLKWDEAKAKFELQESNGKA